MAVNEWTLPANVAAAPRDLAWLETFRIETRRLIAAVPDVAPPYSDEEDFRRRALCWRDTLVRVYAPPLHPRFELVVPEDFAIALDAVRPLRRALAGEIVQDAPAGMLIDAALLQRALPEDIVALLASGPPRELVSTMLMVNERNPADEWHRFSTGVDGFTSAASADGDSIAVYAVDCDDALRGTLFHEIAHLNGERHEIEFSWFVLAAGLEEGGYMHRERAAVSVQENWAVHLGECVFGEDADTFAEFCDRAPLRAAVLGCIMQRLVEHGHDQWNEPAAIQRALHLTTSVRESANARLREIIARCDDNSPEGVEKRALILLLALAGGQPLDGFASRKEVNVSGALLTHRALNSLSLFTALESLDVSGTLIARGGLSALPELTQLRRLNLQGTGVYSSDLKHIGGLQQLEWLDVSGTNINDTAVAVFARMPALRHLRVAGTAIGHTADELHAALPLCEIDV